MELDKISSLPSGVTQQILSFLPIREAVRTSILSSNWRHKWAMLRHLVFDDQCVSDSHGRMTKKTFENIVDHVLLVHSGPIDTFRLSSRNFRVPSCIDTWILHLLRNSNSIKEFILKPKGNGSPYNISSCLFLCPDLTHLKLYNCLLKPPMTFKGFPRLKSLNIKQVIVGRAVLEKVIGSCPLLERMTLCDLIGLTNLNINVPNLQFLKVGGGFQVNLWNTPNLVGLKVTGFRGVQADVDFLKVLLLRSPALQELEISFEQKKNMMRLDDNRNCISTQLRVLKITGFSGGVKDEIDFIRFLLSSSPVLERMTLQPTSANVSWELPKMLEDFRHVKKTFMDPVNSW